MTTSDLQPSKAPQIKEWRWTRHRKCVRLSRSQLRKQLVTWGAEHFEENAVALLSEVFTNAVLHGPHGHEIKTRFILHTDRLRIEVDDASSRMPELQTPANDEEHGRGLILLSLLADRWGTQPRAQQGHFALGKTVWFELDT